MHQILFHLPSWLPLVGNAPVYGYGVMLVIGFFCSLQLARFLARHSRIDPELFVNAGLIALLTGVAGARLSHVLENWSVYTDPHRTAWENLVDAVNIRSGGLTFYGGLLLATPCTIAYGVIKKVSIRTGMDIVAPCVMIGLGLGRVGCFLNGCCYGAEASKAQVPWAMQFPYYSNPYLDQVEKHEIDIDKLPAALLTPGSNGQLVPRPPAELKGAAVKEAEAQWSRPVHPAQLYSTITALLIAALLVAAYTLPHVPGRVFALMLLLEAPTRYVLEMLRAEPAVVGGEHKPLHFLPPQSFSMVLSFFLFAAGVALWFAFRGPKIVPGEPEPGAAGFEVPSPA